MSGPNRTFVLQAVGVAVVVGIIFFAFLRPSELDDLAGIEAPGGGDGPTFALPDFERKKGKDRNDSKGDRRPENRPSPARGGAAGAGTNSGAPELPTGAGPADDQYTSTAVALMERVRAPSGEARR